MLETKQVQIDKDTPYVDVCTYGTLRMGCGNYEHLLKGKSEYMGTFTSKPMYTMLGRNSGFPILTNGDSSIVYEVHRVHEQDILKNVHRLEGCTGIPKHENNWYDIEPIETPLGTGWIYIQRGLNVNPNSIIQSGDWLKRNN